MKEKKEPLCVAWVSRRMEPYTAVENIGRGTNLEGEMNEMYTE